MTYEEKLDLILKEIVEARKRTRAKQPIKIYVAKGSELTKRIFLKEIYDILLKLQDDEGIIKIKDVPVDLRPLSEWRLEDNSDHFLIDILDIFDSWYEEYLLRQKSKPANLDWLNLLKVLDVCSDIDQQLQMTRSNTVTIPSFPYPYIGRFLELFPYDSIETRKSYQKYRWEGVQYLLKQKVILEANYDTNDVLGYGNIVIKVDPVKFDDFYKTIQNEFEKRKKTVKKERRPKVSTNQSRVAKEPAIWPDDFRWEGKKFVFGKYGSIGFKSKDRKHIFEVLTSKRGGWATIRELRGDKDASYVRSTIKQIEDRFPEEVKEHVKIVSTQEDDFGEKPEVGAYRIKVRL